MAEVITGGHVSIGSIQSQGRKVAGMTPKSAHRLSVPARLSGMTKARVALGLRGSQS